ncbi:MAG: hypothetical protein J6X55_09875 [Victivallales bacterium]|nr:hypothetical protein [Victivallales bacterium]
MNFINVVPIFTSNIDFAVSEIKRQHQELGLRKFALCMSMHPVGTPAKDHALKTIASAKAIVDALVDTPVEVGVLIQSTLGHGWSGPVPLTNEPWQRTVMADGKVSSRMCPTDKGFRDYVFFCIEEIMKMNPAFLLMDDDFGLRHGECFCPNHVKMFNKATGQNLTQQQLMELVSKNTAEENSLVADFCHQRDELIIEFAKEIRHVIDRYNPNIVCTMCTPGGGHSFVNAVTHALAGNAMPSARVNNAIYGNNYQLRFIELTRNTCAIRHQFKDVPDLIDEADTFPQNYYSENALLFHSHLVNAILCGLTGAKLWMSEFSQPVDTGSQRKYEALFKANIGLYEELQKTVAKLEWTGVKGVLTHPKHLNHPLTTSRALFEPDWNSALLAEFAFPIAFDSGASGGIHALTEKQARDLSDDELTSLFTSSLLLDSTAVKHLTARGFAELMGVRAVEDPKFFCTGEFREGMAAVSGLMWQPVMAKLECTSDAAQVRTWCVTAKNRSINVTKIAPAMVFHTNKLGGRVVAVAWSPEEPYYIVRRPMRRNILLDAFSFLNGDKPLDMVMDIDQQVLVRHGIIDGNTDIAALISLTIDPIPKIRLSMNAVPKNVQLLSPEGHWLTQDFTYADGFLTVPKTMTVCQPVILKIKK